MGYAQSSDQQMCQSSQQSSAAISTSTSTDSKPTFADIKDELLAALQTYGAAKTYDEYAALLGVAGFAGVTGRQIKGWRRFLMDEMEIFLPKPRDPQALQGYRRPKVNPKGEVTISALAFTKCGITIPTMAILDISYVEKNDDPAKPYVGSHIILTYNGEMGSSTSTDEESGGELEQAAPDGAFALP
jgi:hypothetical protein